MISITRLKEWARARDQETRIALGEARAIPYRLRPVPLTQLQCIAASRWAGLSPSDFHVVYVGHPTNWEEHHLPADPGLHGVVTAVWLKELGLPADPTTSQQRRAAGQAIANAVREIQRKRPVHLVLAYLAGSHIDSASIHAWKRLGVVTAGFHWDDRLHFYGHRTDCGFGGPAEVAVAYDLNLTNVARSLPKYWKLGARAMFWPEAANPDFFRRVELPRTHDVVFVGARYGNRERVVEALRRKGISVLARGPGWPDGPVEASELAPTFARGQMVLGLSGIGQSSRATCLKGRDFEATMSGAAYLPSFNPELPLVFSAGTEIEMWHAIPDLAATVERLLRSPTQLEQLRTKASQRAHRDHTWARRIETLACILGNGWKAPPNTERLR